MIFAVTRWPAVQHLSFPVRDVRQAAAFYRDFLGFLGLAEPGDDIAELVMGETKLVILKASGAIEAPKDLHFGFREGSPSAVDDWGRKAREANVKIDFGPGRTEWGGYVLYLRDPDGYMIEIWADH